VLIRKIITKGVHFTYFVSIVGENEKFTEKRVDMVLLVLVRRIGKCCLPLQLVRKAELFKN